MSYQTDQRRGSTFVDLSGAEISARTRLRIERIAREIRLTDQILSPDLDTVKVVEKGPAPAWTSLEGDEVSFAWQSMPLLEHPIDVAVWLGTNAHELGHVLFSPRLGSTLMYRVIEADKAFMPGLAMLHNIVEDQREERLLLAKFKPWRAYLVAALGHHLKVDDGDSWLLLAGRSWLPQDVRDLAEAMMRATRGSHVTDEVTRIIGEYQYLTDPGDTEADEAWALLNELHAHFADDMPVVPNMACTVMEGGEPDTDQPGDDAPPVAGEATERESDGGSKTGDGQGEGDAEGEGDGEGEGGSGAGTKGRDPNRPPPSVKSSVKQAAKDILRRDADALSDIESVMEALDYGRPGEPHGAEKQGHWVTVTDAARVLHREVADALLDIKDDNEPGWNRRVDGGRLSVPRLLNPNIDADELFDRYDPGMMEASELHVVLLLDVSGSMGSATYRLAEATWAIQHAIDDLEGTCTVYTWDSGPHRVLASGEGRPDARMFVPAALGGTNPSSALLEAHRLLVSSEATNRICVILTDGAWSGDADATIAAMNDEGQVTTVCALLHTYQFVSETQDLFHGCKYGADINDPSDLARLFREVAAERMASWR